MAAEFLLFYYIHGDSVYLKAAVGVYEDIFVPVDYAGGDEMSVLWIKA